MVVSLHAHKDNVAGKSICANHSRRSVVEVPRHLQCRGLHRNPFKGWFWKTQIDATKFSASFHTETQWATIKTWARHRTFGLHCAPVAVRTTEDFNDRASSAFFELCSQVFVTHPPVQEKRKPFRHYTPTGKCPFSS